ncbi:MAG: hypothetical protein KA297_24085 [Kofleriaceae bacterium]|nr:hypothetical protein [Kofleriaceae bacterium]MBP6840726.1 hypothetical protein [Kofleriaceae bacterium]
MAVVTFGTSYVGKIDRVPGTGYVVTRAFQIVNVPLIPLGGFIVAEGTETQSFVSGLKSFEGVAVPVSMRSFAWAILRAVWFAGGLLALLGLGVIWLELQGVAAVLGGPVLGAALLATWWASRRGLRASPARAVEVTTHLRAPGGTTSAADVSTYSL